MTSPDPARAANLLGALSLVGADQMSDALASSGHTHSDAAALSALLHFLDHPSVDLLRKVLGLTSSGTVRLIDRLVEQGLVERVPAADRRSSSVALTRSGRQTARRLTAARADLFGEYLDALSAHEQAVFERLIGKVLSGRIRAPGATRWICRLCDTGACGRADGHCPVANAAMARYRPD